MGEIATGKQLRLRMSRDGVNLASSIVFIGLNEGNNLTAPLGDLTFGV